MAADEATDDGRHELLDSVSIFENYFNVYQELRKQIPKEVKALGYTRFSIAGRLNVDLVGTVNMVIVRGVPGSTDDLIPSNVMSVVRPVTVDPWMLLIVEALARDLEIPDGVKIRMVQWEDKNLDKVGIMIGPIPFDRSELQVVESALHKYQLRNDLVHFMFGAI